MKPLLPHRDPPRLSGAAAGAWLLAFVAIAALQLAADSLTLKSYDEGLILYGAARVAHGAVPYRDFWSMYGPGSFYALAGLDRLFGESVLLGRCFDAAARAAVVVLVFALTWRRCGRFAAGGAAAVAFGLLVSVREYLFPALPATAFALLAMLALDRALARCAVVQVDAPGAARAWALPGAAVGVTLLFRPDFGVYTALACLCPLLTREQAALGRRLAAFAVGALMIAGPPIAALLVQVPLRDLYDNLLRIPLQVYVANRALPFPSVARALGDAIEHHAVAPVLPLAIYLPLLVATVSVPMALYRRFAGTPPPRDPRRPRALFEALVVLNALLCLKGAVRVEVLQMLPAMMVSIVLVARALVRPGARGLSVPGAALLLVALVGAAGAVVARAVAPQGPAHRAPPALALADWRHCGAAAIPRLGCFVLDEHRAEVLAYLQRHAKAGDLLYVGTGRHDKLFVNNVELYFLSGLAAATKWHDLHPGVQTTRALQSAMIAEMNLHPPAFVVLNSEWDDRAEPNLSRVSSGVTLLDDYLRERFVVELRAGSFTVSVPRGPAPQVGRAP